MHVPMFFYGIVTVISLAAASPLQHTSDIKPGFCARQHNANYDDLAVGDVPLLNNIPVPYQGLAYKNFKSSSDGLVSTIAAHTTPNTVGFSLLTDVTGGAPTITRKYKDSPINHFDLDSVWLSCVTINPVGVYLPASCTVQAVGTKHTSGKKVYGNLSFHAPTIPKLKLGKKKTKQQKATFPKSFNGLESVQFSVVSAGVDANITNVAFDNLVYTSVVSC